MAAHINDEMLNKMDAYWRAANYLAAGQLYLLDNPLLKEPLKPEHIKKKIVGHWGHGARSEPDLRSPEPHHQAV